MTRILHISDTHGGLPALDPDGDVIVHSGDLLPNRTFGIRVVEEAYQKAWIKNNAVRLRSWLGDRPFLLSHGNHDYVDAVPLLRDIGIDAHGLDDRKYTHDGVTFYGFPHIPYFAGGWNRECGKRELEHRTKDIDLEGVDVVVAHAPIYGVLDRAQRGERCGSKPMRHRLGSDPHNVRLYLCGHIHEAAGRLRWTRDIDVSNAACIQRVVAFRS